MSGGRCTRYDLVPDGCRLVSDFTNPCCKILRCDPNAVTGTPTPGTTGVPDPNNPVTTRAPNPNGSLAQSAFSLLEQVWLGTIHFLTFTAGMARHNPH